MGALRRLRGGPPVIALLVAAALVVVGLASWVTARSLDHQRGERQLVDAFQPGHVGLARAIDAAVQDAHLQTPTESSPSSVSAREGGSSDELALATTAARDTGAPRVAVLETQSGRGTAVAVVPRYAGGDLPATTQARRTAFTGIRVVDLAVPSLVEEAFEGLPGATEVRDGRHRLDDGGDHSAHVVLSTTFEIAGRTWTVESFAPVPGPPLITWSFLGVPLGLAVVVLFAATRRVRITARAELTARRRAHEAEVVAEVVPVLQSSLDLAEVLPSVALLLADEFDLGHAAVLVADDAGGLREVFTVGTAGGPSPSHVGELRAPQSSAPAGQTFVVPLQRGGRGIGAVVARAHRDVDADDMRALLALVDLLGAAIVNVRAFEREHASVRRLEELDRLKTEFMGTVSHEIRTPLAAIVGFAHVLDVSGEDIDDEQRRDYLRRIGRNAMTLTTLLQQVLDFSRLERRQMKVHLSELDVVAVLRDALDRMSSILENHRVVMNGPDTLMMTSDPDVLERVLANLLTNAGKYAPAGTTVTVTVTRDDGEARITVDDEGPGVPVEERSRIFERFYRGASDVALRTRGAGIGLAIVKDLLERVGGSVEAAAAPGGGARFVVTLPFHPTTPAGGALATTGADSS